MELERSELNYVKKLMMARYPRFGSEIAEAKLQYNKNLPYHTAATDGKNIYFDPNYLKSLTDDEKLFIIAHELMHIKFEHTFRLKDKNGNLRDREVWNIATDAIINANLERDGFKIKEGYVNMPNALNYTSEQLYDILLKEKEKRQKEKAEQSSQNGGSTPNENGNGENSDKTQGSAGEKSGNSKQQSGDPSEQNEKNKSQSGDGNSSGQNAENMPNEDGMSDSASNSNSNSSNNSANKANYNDIPEDIFDREYADDHTLWDDATKEKSESKKSILEDRKKESETKITPKDIKGEIEFDKYNEKAEFADNRRERLQRARERLERAKSQEMSKSGEKIEFGDIGEAKEILDWKSLLRREVEKSETIWSQRKSIAENNYAYRLEENDVEDEAETEVMIDVSGSVSLDMVKAFLRQLKPILKHSKLKVGCFNEKFWGMTEIKYDRDINNFKIPAASRGHSAWTEDWDLAVRSFTPKREVNKIVFTDGVPCPGTMPKDDLRGTNVLWLVYSNRNFSPCCGKVIQISAKALQELQSLKKNEEELTR